MEDAVTHYIESHQTDEDVNVDANTLALNVQDDGVARVAIMHAQTYSTSLCRQVSVGDQVTEGQWGEELLDPDCRLAAFMAHITQQSRAQMQQPHHKVQTVRADVDASVLIDNSMRLFSGQTLDTSIVADTNGPVLELNPGASPGQNRQQSKKSLPHKKRISRKLTKKNNGSSTPQQDIVVINCSEDGQQEEILPDNFVTSVQHEDLRPDEGHDIATHEVVRPIFICQLCGEFYGEDQLKFYQHLKHHYEPHNTIIIENPVTDLGIDKMTSSCIVDNVAILPDSIVELSLENSVPVSISKVISQSIDKHVLYTTSDKTLNFSANKVQYSMSSMDKGPPVTTEVDKVDLYDTLEKLELYNCVKCSKTFRKQKQCEAHMKEAHSAKYNLQLEDMGEFSEPEDLMEGIHVAVEESDHYAQVLLPDLTVTQHDSHRHWYSRSPGGPGTPGVSGVSAMSGVPGVSGVSSDVSGVSGDVSGVSGDVSGVSGEACPSSSYCGMYVPAPREQAPSPQQLKVLKEEVLQRILETEVSSDNGNFTENILTESPEMQPETPPGTNEDSNSKDATENKKKSQKRFECPQCGRVFHHRNSLLYHLLSHSDKQQVCRECGKGFYTVTALKIHKRVHNGDRPYKCEMCDKDFRQWSDLKYHKVSIHSNQKSFKCEFCGKEFARKYSLNVHRRIHTGERNYKCEYCNMTFRASCYRLSHMRTHTSDKPHKCPECDKCFRVAADLRRHLLIHEKVRNRLSEPKTKDKNLTDDIKPHAKTDEKHQIKVEIITNNKNPKKVAVASTTKMPTDATNNKICARKASKSSKKNQPQKKGAPNITVHQLNRDYTNVEIFDTRQEPPYAKFKEIYNDNSYKDELDNVIEYKNLSEDRDFAILRPTYRHNLLIDAVEMDKTVFRENTDGKMQVYTHVEKGKDFSNSEVSAAQLPLGDTAETGFLERLTAIYNIPAV